MSVALVTGGVSGLGLATATALHESGYEVVVVDLPDARGKDALPSGIVFAPADVRDEEQVSAALARATELGDVRVAVNCAGTGVATKTVSRGTPHPLDEFRRIIDINLVGTFNVIRLTAAAMEANDVVDGERGVIVNTASVAAYDPQIGQVAYSASKGGVVSLTLAVARDLARSNIRCVTIAPGLFDTPLFSTMPQEARDQLASLIPQPSRLGDPVEFAALAVHIAGNGMLNGEVVRLDGALRMPAR